MVPGSAWELMREFLQGFLGSVVSNQAPQYLQVSLALLCYTRFEKEAIRTPVQKMNTVDKIDF